MNKAPVWLGRSDGELPGAVAGKHSTEKPAGPTLTTVRSWWPPQHSRELGWGEEGEDGAAEGFTDRAALSLCEGRARAWQGRRRCSRPLGWVRLVEMRVFQLPRASPELLCFPSFASGRMG